MGTFTLDLDTARQIILQTLVGEFNEDDSRMAMWGANPMVRKVP